MRGPPSGGGGKKKKNQGLRNRAVEGTLVQSGGQNKTWGESPNYWVAVARAGDRKKAGGVQERTMEKCG